MKLYGYWRSSSSWRVRIGLALKGIAYEYAAVHLVRDGGEQRRDDYRAINPMQQVPVLEYEEGGVTRRLAQSVAILEFLEERTPAPPLLPADAYLRARARELVQIVNSGIQPFQNLAVIQKVKEELGADEQAFARGFIERGLEGFEAAARDLAGRCCIGDEVTLADVYLVPQLYQARRFGADVQKYPLLLRIEEACAALPAFQAAHPSRQPDTPPEA